MNRHADHGSHVDTCIIAHLFTYCLFGFKKKKKSGIIRETLDLAKSSALALGKSPLSLGLLAAS